jgi:hypothetical protein
MNKEFSKLECIRQRLVAKSRTHEKCDTGKKGIWRSSNLSEILIETTSEETEWVGKWCLVRIKRYCPPILTGRCGG